MIDLGQFNAIVFALWAIFHGADSLGGWVFMCLSMFSLLLVGIASLVSSGRK